MPPYIDIGISKYYMQLRYQLPQIIVHSVCLNSKLGTCYVCLLSSVRPPILAKYKPKRAPPIAMVGTTFAGRQDCNYFSLPELL